jgi:hypothetical protein
MRIGVAKMRQYITGFTLAFLTLAPIYASAPSSQFFTADDHTQWVATILKEIQSIKVGMNRIDLLKVFKEEGGVSTRISRRYTYRDCPYIRVDVEFEQSGCLTIQVKVRLKVRKIKS